MPTRAGGDALTAGRAWSTRCPQGHSPLPSKVREERLCSRLDHIPSPSSLKASSYRKALTRHYSSLNERFCKNAAEMNSAYLGPSVFTSFNLFKAILLLLDIITVFCIIAAVLKIV